MKAGLIIIPTPPLSKLFYLTGEINTHLTSKKKNTQLQEEYATGTIP